MFGWFEKEIGAILMPGDIRSVTGLLDPAGHMVDQNVRPDQAFNGIQHRRQADQFVHPWKQQVGLGPNLAREATKQSTLVGLKVFELSAEVVDLLGTQRIKWSGEHLFPVGSNVFFFQFHNELEA